MPFARVGLLCVLAASSLALRAGPVAPPPAGKPAPAPDTAPPVDRPGGAPASARGWTALFNGKDLAGWTPFLPDPGADPSTVWSVRDGAIHCEGKPAGYLATTGSYTSFELELEWRFDPAKGEGNSGVLLRVQPPDQVWPRSVEAQLHSRNAGDIWNIGEVPMRTDPERTKGRRTEKAHPTNEKPLGEWNAYRIVLDGGDLKLFVNGVLQNHATDVAIMPGRIALQSEGAHIEFRNIRVRALPDGGTGNAAPGGAARPAPEPPASGGSGGTSPKDAPRG
jgi:hypothetical protein